MDETTAPTTTTSSSAHLLGIVRAAFDLVIALNESDEVIALLGGDTPETFGDPRVIAAAVKIGERANDIQGVVNAAMDDLLADLVSADVDALVAMGLAAAQATADDDDATEAGE